MNSALHNKDDARSDNVCKDEYSSLQAERPLNDRCSLLIVSGAYELDIQQNDAEQNLREQSGNSDAQEARLKYTTNLDGASSPVESESIASESNLISTTRVVDTSQQKSESSAKSDLPLRELLMRDVEEPEETEAD